MICYDHLIIDISQALVSRTSTHPTNPKPEQEVPPKTSTRRPSLQKKVQKPQSSNSPYSRQARPLPEPVGSGEMTSSRQSDMLTRTDPAAIVVTTVEPVVDSQIEPALPTPRGDSIEKLMVKSIHNFRTYKT